MLYIFSNKNEPWYNIAAEEYLLKNFKEDILYLYINSPSVVVGKHQNAIAEVNMDFANRNGLKIIRRISGGGAVYHDAGNLNFCFIKNFPDSKDIAFRLFTSIIVDSLVSLGIDARHQRKSDIFIKHNKISGNAMHVYKNRVLEHGTLLFNSNIDNLKMALKDSSDKFRGKGVKSVKSEVANISEHMKQKLTMNGFVEKISFQIISHLSDIRAYSFNETDITQINNLVKEKYSTWKWNFGYSPKYEIESQLNKYEDAIYFSIKVEKGLIVNPEIRDNKNRRLSSIEAALDGLRHKKRDILEKLRSQNMDNITEGIRATDFVNKLF